MDATDLTLRFVVTDELSRVLDSIGQKVQAFGNAIEKIGGVVGNVFGSIFKAIGDVIPIIGGVVAAGGGLFGVLDHLASKTAEYAQQIVLQSNTLKINTDLMQTLVQAGDLVGISQDRLNNAFLLFTRNLENGGRQLKASGLDLKDLGITTADTQEAFLQLADHFQAMGNSADAASQKITIMRDLFGKGGAEGLISVLSQGRDGIAKLTSEFKDFGLVLDPTTLKVDALGKVMQDRFHMALDGMLRQLGSALIPAFITLWGTLANVFQGTMQASDGVEHLTGFMEQLSHAAAMAVVWIASFIGELTGNQVNLDNFLHGLESMSAILSLNSGAAQGAGASLDGTGDAAKRSEAAIKALQQATKEQTESIKDQVTALQDQQKAFDEASQQQIDALHAEESGYNDLADAQVKSLELQRSQLELDQSRADAQATLSDAQKRVAADQAELARAPFIGETDLTPIYDKLQRDQEALAKEQNRINFESQKQQLDDKISAIQAAKTAHDKELADQIAGVEKIKKAQDDAMADRIRSLQEESTAIAQAAQDQEAAMRDSAAGAAGAFGDLATSVGGDAGSMKDAIDSFTKWFKDPAMAGVITSGQGAADTVKNAFKDFSKDPSVAAAMVDMGKLIFDGVKAGFENSGGLIGILFGQHIAWFLDVPGRIGDIARDLQRLAANPAPLFGLPNQPSGPQPDTGGPNEGAPAAPGGGFVGPGAPNTMNPNTFSSQQMASGGILSEPVFGIGLNTGTRYSLAEAGPEMVVPMGGGGGSSSDVGGLLEEIRNYLRMMATSGGGSYTGIEALVQKLISDAGYAASRGVRSYG